MKYVESTPNAPVQMLWWWIYRILWQGTIKETKQTHTDLQKRLFQLDHFPRQVDLQSHPNVMQINWFEVRIFGCYSHDKLFTKHVPSPTLFNVHKTPSLILGHLFLQSWWETARMVSSCSSSGLISPHWKVDFGIMI